MGALPVRERSYTYELFAGALAMLTSGPAARSALAFFELFLSTPNAPLPSDLLFGIFHPTDELVAPQRRDVLPQRQRRGIRDQRRAQICGHPVHYSPSDLRATHGVAAAGAGPIGSYPGGGGPFSEWYPGGNGGPDGSGAAYGSRILPGFEDSGAFVEMYPGGS